MKRIGDITPWGKVVAIGWVGERYYWLEGKDRTIAMMPATAVET